MSQQDPRASNLPARAFQNLQADASARGTSLGPVPQAVIHLLVEIHACTISRPFVRARLLTATGRNDYDCLCRSSAEGVATNHAGFGAADSRACMHACTTHDPEG